MDTYLVKRMKAFIKYYLLKYFTYNKFRDELDILFKYFIKTKESKNKVMFDVGAHLGEVSYNYLKEGFCVYAFEPDLNETKIRSLNQLKIHKNFQLSQLAASDVSNQELDFYTSNVSTGISSALKFHGSHTLAGKVKTIALKDFIKEKEIKGIDFVKIDTEGYDYFVIKGLGLDVLKPNFIICEYENAKSEGLGYKFIDMLNYLYENGYKVIISEWYPIQQYGKGHKWKQFLYFPDLPDENSWGNFIAIHPLLFPDFKRYILNKTIS